MNKHVAGFVVDHKYFCAWFGLIVPWGLFFAWLLMLTIGLAHRHWWDAMPPAGYVFCMVVTAILMLLGGLGQVVKIIVTEMVK